MITQKVRRSGGSLAVTIPKEEVERLDLHEGDTVAVQLNKVTLRMQVHLPDDIRDLARQIMRERAADIAYLADR